MLCLGVLCLGGCLDGRPLPEATRLITIKGGTFPMGLGDNPTMFKCGDPSTPEIEHCDSGKQEDDYLAWIDDLSWVPRAEVKDLPDFRIEEHEVTTLQYRGCVEYGHCTEPVDDTINDQPYYGERQFDAHPVVNVTRRQAATYCRHIGRVLPTEAQWERAARLGPAPDFEMYVYPWKGLAPSTCAQGIDRYATALGCADVPPPVDYSEADKNSWGVRNMASNVAEWVADAWHKYAYCKDRRGYKPRCQELGESCEACKADGLLCAKSCKPKKLVICKGGVHKPYINDQANERVVRGGSYLYSKCFHRLFVRRKGTEPKRDIGFRCAVAGK